MAGAERSGTKTCPMCAETIHVAATVCRFCGFESANLTVWGHGPQSTNGMAIASLVLGIVWLFGLGSILALVFGYRARRQLREAAGREDGWGMATAGIVLGWIGVAPLLMVLAAPLVMLLEGLISSLF